jgi:NAD(P)-dependent dehydrogenase (short-subunit alcohol dehydrogenase family)
VLVGSRDLARGEEAVAQLKADGQTNVGVLHIDLDDLPSIAAARDTIAQTYGGTAARPDFIIYLKIQFIYIRVNSFLILI